MAPRDFQWLVRPWCEILRGYRYVTKYSFLLLLVIRGNHGASSLRQARPVAVYPALHECVARCCSPALRDRLRKRSDGKRSARQSEGIAGAGERDRERGAGGHSRCGIRHRPERVRRREPAKRRPKTFTR